MLRVALREIRAHLVRFALSVLAVALASAFVTGTFSLRAMLADTFASIVASTTQGDLYVRGAERVEAAEGTGGGPPSGSPEPLSEPRRPVPIELAATVADVAGVDQAVPDLLGTVVLVGADGQAVVNGQAPSLGSVLRPDDPSGTLLAGRAPRHAGEVALETTALQTSGLSLGDETQIVLARGGPRTVTVVGEATYGNPMVGTTLVLLDPATGETELAPDGRVPSVAVFLETGADLATVRDRVAAALDDDEDVEVVTGEQVRAEATETVNRLLGFLGTFLLVFALIALFVGLFIVTNTFAMTVRQRQREFALLRAIGASPAQVLRTVLLQAAVVGAAGAAAGIAGGIGLVALVRVLLAMMGMDLAGDVVITGAQAAAVVGLGTAAAMVAAAVPARRAATTPPVEAMRDDAVVVERSLRLRATIGTVVLLTGAAATVVSVQESTTSAGTWLGVGAGGVLLGTVVLSPALARTVLGVLAAPFVAVLRPVGRLARGNVTRSPRRTASTAGALMIGMALVGASAVLAESAQASTRAIVETGSRADLWVQSATRTVPEELAAQIAALPEVGRADTVRSGQAVLTDGGRRTERVLGLPAAAFGRTIEVTTSEGSVGDLADGEAAVARTAAVAHGWEVGDTLTFDTAAGERSVRIGAVIDSQLLDAPVVLDEARFGELVPASTVLAVLVDAAAGVDAATLRETLQATAAPYLVVSVRSSAELTSSLAEQVDQALTILYALLGLSVIIAVLGIVNTLALSVTERTREIGLVRAVGLSRMQLAGTIVVESALTALYGTVLGVALGVGLAAALPSVLEDQGLTELAVPWDVLGVMVLASGAVGVLAAVGPAWRAASLPVLEAIAQE